MSGAKFCWQEITVLLKAASPNACEPAGFNLWGGVCLCMCTHTDFLQALMYYKLAWRKKSKDGSFQHRCLMLVQMAYDLPNITITFHAGGHLLPREEKIIFVFLKGAFVLSCQLAAYDMRG